MSLSTIKERMMLYNNIHDYIVMCTGKYEKKTEMFQKRNMDTILMFDYENLSFALILSFQLKGK